MPSTLHERLAAYLALLARPRVAEMLPVKLDRRRVYVLPTRFGLFFSALLLAMLLGALNYNNNPALLLALLLATTGLASLMAAHLQLSGLQVDALSAEPVAAGQALQVHMALSAADARTRRGLQLKCNDISTPIPVMAAQEPVVATFTLETQHRGWLDLRRLRN